MLRKLLGTVFKVAIGKFSKEEKEIIYHFTLKALEQSAEGFGKGLRNGN